MGLCANWPAVRVGGVLPEDLRNIDIPIYSGHFTAGSKVRITVTDPNGNDRTPVVCTSSPCRVVADARQGTHSLFRVDSLDASDALKSRGDSIPLYVH